MDDEGSPLGVATELDFVGAGVTATLVGRKATITIPGGSSASPAPLAAAFPAPADFPNASRWTVDPQTGLWVLAANQNAAVIDVKTDYTQLGNPALANPGALSAAGYSGGVLTWTITALQDWSTSGGSSALLYWTIPMPILSDDIQVIAIRIVTPVGLAETGYFGLLLADEATPTISYLRAVQGYIGGSHTGYSQAAGTFGAAFGNFTLSQANQEAGVWHRFIALPTGSVLYQTSPVVTDSYDVAANTGVWTTQRTTATTSVSTGTLRIGLFAGKGATATPLTFTGRQLTTLTPAWNYGRATLPGFGWARSRTLTAVPPIAAVIGASATYSDAEVIARLSRALSRGPNTATIRALIQRGTFAQPADGAAGWVTYAGGTFPLLATVGTGAQLAIWIDVASTLGAQPVTFDPRLFGALGIT